MVMVKLVKLNLLKSCNKKNLNLKDKIIYQKWNNW